MTAARRLRPHVVTATLGAVALAIGACGGSSARSATPAAAPAPNGYRAAGALPKLNFDQMLEMKIIPGDEDRALLLTRDGMVRRVSLSDPAEEPSVFMDIRDRIIKNPGQEEGLLGLAFSPDYATTGKFYLYFSAGGPRRQVLSRFTARGASADPSSEQVLLEIQDPYSNHNGGALTFGPDGYLYVGEGDGGSQGDPNGNGQNTNVLLAKILRLDVSGDGYTIPPDNPFADGGGRPEVWAYGLRNPWRINFDPATDRLWVGDVGQDKYEEVDVVTKGANYGWNVMEGKHCYKPASGCDMDGLTLPRAEYTHSDGCSITGGYVYRGAAMPELDGYYIYGDFCSGKVWGVDTAGDDSEPVLLMDSGLSISSFAQDQDRELYIIDLGGKIARLARK